MASSFLINPDFDCFMCANMYEQRLLFFNQS
jgi:hypothetical protein